MIIEGINNPCIKKMKHCIGLDYKNPKRGKYKAWRNYCMYYTPNSNFEHLVHLGYANVEIVENEHYIPKISYYYILTREGLDFLENIIGAKIERR